MSRPGFDRVLEYEIRMETPRTGYPGLVTDLDRCGGQAEITTVPPPCPLSVLVKLLSEMWINVLGAGRAP